MVDFQPSRVWSTFLPLDSLLVLPREKPHTNYMLSRFLLSRICLFFVLGKSDPCILILANVRNLVCLHALKLCCRGGSASSWKVKMMLSFPSANRAAAYVRLFFTLPFPCFVSLLARDIHAIEECSTKQGNQRGRNDFRMHVRAQLTLFFSEIAE